MYFGLKNISIKYGHRLILDNMSIEFPHGKITTIIGRNGCGKSSLLKIFTKQVKPLGEGTSIFKQKKMSEYSPKELAKKISVLPQIHSAPPDIDIYTLVSYGRFPHKKFGHRLNLKDREIILDSIEKTGLKGMEHARIKTLSGGESQRAWIAMSICQQPEILVLDEPTTHLDINFQVEILSLIKKLNSELGITVVMVLHDLNLAARYSDLIYTIKDGKLAKSGSPIEVFTQNTIRDIFSVDSYIGHDQVYDCPYFLPRDTVYKTKI